jgi:WD40 repeat protein
MRFTPALDIYTLIKIDQHMIFTTGKRILMLNLLLVVFLSGYTICGNCQSSAPINDEFFKQDIIKKLDINNTDVEETAIEIAKDYPGSYNINQICAIYDYLMKGNWAFLSETNGFDKIKYANYTLRLGKPDFIGIGDCDDFAVLIASLIESLGGTTKINYAWSKIGPDNEGKFKLGGHAYAEVYLGEIETRDGMAKVENLISWLMDNYNINRSELNKGVTRTNNEAWLNLDWWKDNRGKLHPGGPYFKSNYPSNLNPVIRDEIYKRPPKIIPTIDKMNRKENWESKCIDSKGKERLGPGINLTEGIKDKALEMQFNLKENEMIVLTRKLTSPADLLEIEGLKVLYKGKGYPNTIELRLCTNKAEYGVYWNQATSTDDWSSHQALFKNFLRFDPKNNRYSNEEIGMTNDQLKSINKIKLVISNNPDKGDRSGQVSIAFDDINGVLAIPTGSLWERIEDQHQRELASRLAAQSVLLGEDLNSLTLSALLAIESLNRSNSLEAYKTLKADMDLIPLPLLKLNYSGSVNALAFSPDSKYLAGACDDNTTRIWEILTGKEKYILPHGGKVKLLDYHKDGIHLATWSEDNTVRIWTLAEKPSFITINCSQSIIAIKYSHWGRYLAILSQDPFFNFSSGSNSTLLEIYNIEKENKNKTNINRTFSIKDVMDFDFSNDETILATSTGYSIDLWEMPDGINIGCLRNENGLNNYFLQNYGLAFSSDGRYLTSVGPSRTDLWEIPSKKWMAGIEAYSPSYGGNFAGYRENLHDEVVDFYDDNLFIYSAGIDSILLWQLVNLPLNETSSNYILDAANCRKITSVIDTSRIKSEMSYHVVPFRIFGDSNNILSVIDGNIIRFWKVDDKVQLKEFGRIPHEGTITDVDVTLVDCSFYYSGTRYVISNYCVAVTGANITRIWLFKHDWAKTEDFAKRTIHDLYSTYNSFNDDYYLSDLDMWGNTAVIKNIDDDGQRVINLSLSSTIDPNLMLGISSNGTHLAFENDTLDNATKYPILNIMDTINGTLSRYSINTTRSQILSPKWTYFVDYNDTYLNRYLADFDSWAFQNFGYSFYYPMYVDDSNNISLINISIIEEILRNDINSYIKVINISSSKEQLSIGLGSSVESFIRFTPDDEYFMISILNETEKIWDIKIYHLPSSNLTCAISVNNLADFSLSPDNKHLAVASDEGLVSILDLTNNKSINTSIRYGVRTIRFSPDGESLFVLMDSIGDRSQEMIIFDTVSLNFIGRIPLNYMNKIEGLKLSHDGKYVAFYDGIYVRIFDLDKYEEISRIEFYEDNVNLIGFSRNDKYLMFEGTSNLILFTWKPTDLISEACKRITRNLSNEEWQEYLGDEPYRGTCLCNR